MGLSLYQCHVFLKDVYILEVMHVNAESSVRVYGDDNMYSDNDDDRGIDPTRTALYTV